MLRAGMKFKDVIEYRKL